MMVIKYGHDNKLMQMTYDGTSWEGNTEILVGQEVVQSNEKPALGRYLDTAILIYKGSSTVDIRYSTYKDGVWSGNTHIPEIGKPKSSHGISATSAPSGVWFTYQGESDVLQNLYIAGWGPT